MKFVCDRCGKKYATAEDPAPGKVYKLKCKACGHLIVVKGQAGTMTGVPAITAAEAAMATQAQEPALTPVPGSHPEIELHVEPEPAPAPPPGTSAAALAPEPEAISDDAIEAMPPVPPGASPLPPEVALAVDGAAAASHPEPLSVPPEPAREETAPVVDPALIPPSPEKDELADFAAAAAEVMAAPFGSNAGEAGARSGPGYVDLFGDITDQQALAARSSITDAFSAAARASLPDTWTGATPTGQAPAPASTAAKLAAPPAPAVGQPAPRKASIAGTPVAIVGIGILALIGITAWALLGRGSAPSTPVASQPRPVPRVELSKPAPEVTPPPAPPPAARVEPERAPEPKAAEKRPEPKPEARPKAPERKPEKRPEPKVAEKKPEPPAPTPAPAQPPPQAQAQEPREGELPDAATALTQDVVNRVVGANRKAFTSCISNAKEAGVTLDGRHVALRITVNTNGTVTYPTLDDQSLNATEMGQCLKSAARLMIFPKFKGDPFHYEVPLILSGT